MTSEAVQIDYYIGSQVSVIISSVITLSILLFCYRIPTKENKLEYDDFEHPVLIVKILVRGIRWCLRFVLFDLVQFLIQVIPIWMAAYFFTFAILNFLGQSNLSQNLQLYLEQDTLNLRFVSITMPIAYIKSLFNKRKKYSLRNSFVLSHNTIYVIVCYHLWLLKIYDYNSVADYFSKVGDISPNTLNYWITLMESKIVTILIYLTNYINNITSWSLLIYFGYWNTISEYITDEDPKVTNKFHMILVYIFFMISCLGFLIGGFVDLPFIYFQAILKDFNHQGYLNCVLMIMYLISGIIFYVTLRIHFPQLDFLRYSGQNLQEFWLNTELVKAYFEPKKDSLSKNIQEE